MLIDFMARVVILKIALPFIDVETIEKEMDIREDAAERMGVDLDMHEKYKIAALCGFDGPEVTITGIGYCDCENEDHPPMLVVQDGMLLDARFENRVEFDDDEDEDEDDEDDDDTVSA